MQGKVRVGRCGELSVLGPHTSIHFPTSPLFLSPHAYTLPHSPHTLSHTLPTQLSLPPPTPPIFLPTAPLTSPYTPTHFFIHSMHSPTPLRTFRLWYVAKLPCDDVTLMKLTRKAR